MSGRVAAKRILRGVSGVAAASQAVDLASRLTHARADGSRWRAAGPSG